MARFGWIVALICSAWAGYASPKAGSANVLSSDASPRVAVLCEQKDTELLGLSEQVEVLLAQRNDLAMLDRANMDQILREQGLMAKQGQDIETMVRIGKLLRADLLVVAGKYEGFFAWRFVDVKNGVLAGLHVTRWPAEQRSVAASEAEKAIVATTRQIGDASGEGKRYLSIVRFVNQDISRQYDSLEEVLPVLLSAQLASQPGIGLVERSRLSKVAEEKLGTAGTEGGYKAGTLIVKGEISILRSNATSSVSVLLLAGKPNQEATIRLTCRGSLGDLPLLARVMKEQLLKAMEVKTQETSSTDTTAEADTFYLKANFFMAQKDYRSAVSLYKTACLLNSTNVVYQEAYRGSRREIIGNGGFTQEERLRYYIEDVDDWKSRMSSGIITPANVSQEEGWYNTGCIALGKPQPEPLADQWRIAYDGYREVLDAMFDYCQTNKVATAVTLREHLWRYLLPQTPYTVLQRMHKHDPKNCQKHEQSAFFKDPKDFCHYFRKYVDAEYPPFPRASGGCQTLTPDIAIMSLRHFVSLHVCSQDGISAELDPYAHSVFDGLLQDANPLIRIWSKLALIHIGYDGEMFVVDGRPELGQSIVNELACWKFNYLPFDYIMMHINNMHTSHLLLYLIHKDRRNLMPAVEAVRKALREPGASYTPTLSTLVNQLLRQYDPSLFVNMHINLRKQTMRLDPGGSKKMLICTDYRSTFETITTSYHDWTDILCQHLENRLKGGDKDGSIKDVQKIFLAEKTSDQPEKSRACMAQITKVLQRHQKRCGYNMASITNAVPVVAPKVISEDIHYAKVAWHLDAKDIPNALHHSMSGYIVFKDDKIFYSNYQYSDPKRSPFDVTVIDLATGRILQSLLKDESLRHPADPELGIPKQEVRSWCEMDGRYYVGCVGGLGEFKDGVFTLLASSRKEQVVGPLDGGDSYTVTCIRPNPAKKKLYLLVQGSEKRDGIWEYTPATGEQKRLINLADVMHRRIENFCWDDTHLYVKCDQFTLGFNTQEPEKSFTIAWDFAKNFGIPSTSDFLKELGFPDIRLVGKDMPVNLQRGWDAQAARGQYVVFTRENTHLWKKGEKNPRQLVLLDKSGQELTSPAWLSDVAVAKWTATPRGFVYQLKAGGMGLLSDLDSVVEPASNATNKQATVAEPLARERK
jgi:hypothetical protein